MKPELHERERERLAAALQNRLAAAPIEAELRRAGLAIESLDDLLQTRIHIRFFPILLEWLPRVSNAAIKETLVRALTVRWARPAAPLLVLEFRRASDRSLRWAIGNALSVIADDEVFDDLVKLARDRSHGRSREMIAVALGRMKDPRAADVLVGLLEDAEIAGHAVVGLGKLADPSTRPVLEAFLTHRETWVRKAALRAIARIDKARERAAAKSKARRL